jgi:hypothetical protein
MSQNVAGVRHFIFLVVGDPVAQAQRLTEQVVPVLRAEAAGAMRG